MSNKTDALPRFAHKWRHKGLCENGKHVPGIFATKQDRSDRVNNNVKRGPGGDNEGGHLHMPSSRLLGGLWRRAQEDTSRDRETQDGEMPIDMNSRMPRHTHQDSISSVFNFKNAQETCWKIKCSMIVKELNMVKMKAVNYILGCPKRTRKMFGNEGFKVVSLATSRHAGMLQWRVIMQKRGQLELPKLAEAQSESKQVGVRGVEKLWQVLHGPKRNAPEANSTTVYREEIASATAAGKHPLRREVQCKEG